MFNLKKTKLAQRVTEKYLREENLGPKADDDQPIAEKVLPHRTGDIMTTTEDQIENIGDQLGVSREANVDDTKIIEKVLNDTVKYTSNTKLDVPPINTLVADLEIDRAKKVKIDKESHWSQTSENKQQGQLPEWPKSPKQHDEIVLNNDRRRFEGEKVKPLQGGITTADINRVVHRIKTGEAAEYDIAITAILKEADNDKRELTSIEKRTVSELKKERTRVMMV